MLLRGRVWDFKFPKQQNSERKKGKKNDEDLGNQTQKRSTKTARHSLQLSLCHERERDEIKNGVSEGKHNTHLKDVSHVFDGTENDIPLFIFMAVRRTIVLWFTMSASSRLLKRNAKARIK